MNCLFFGKTATRKTIIFDQLVQFEILLMYCIYVYNYIDSSLHIYKFDKSSILVIYKNINNVEVLEYSFAGNYRELFSGPDTCDYFYVVFESLKKIHFIEYFFLFKVFKLFKIL